MTEAPAEIGPLQPGQCDTASGLWWVGTSDLPVLIKRAQLAGKPAMPAEDILRGYRYPATELGSQGH